ncbi:MAG: AraC family transcriptional regulator [Bacteroidota bacterium]|nr:AraC family transcriptional regulator [Bacteroidota bacterium]
MRNQYEKNLSGDYCFLKQDYGSVHVISGRYTAADNDVFMERINCIIDKNIGNFDFNVDALGEELGISRVHLYRKVKGLTGKSPVLLIRRLRMQRAAKLIDDGAGNLAVISLSIGLLNPSYFSKRFKEFYGNSPKYFVHRFAKETVA